MHLVRNHAILCKLFACTCLTSLVVSIPLPCCLTSLVVSIPLPCMADPPFELGLNQLPVFCAFLLAFALLKLGALDVVHFLFQQCPLHSMCGRIHQV